MEQIKCPGQDTRFWKSDDIFTVECPKCGAEIEFFKDDTRRRCAWCGHLFYNPKIEMGCAEWCQYADKCVPELVKEKQAMQTFKERLRERALALAGEDPELAARLDRGLALATDLLKAEGGDPKEVFAAILLQKVGLEAAKDLLAEMETEPEIAESILEVLASDPGVTDISGQIYRDVLALVEAETGGSVASLQTRTAQHLAENIQPHS
jgi:hypothetical protein